MPKRKKGWEKHKRVIGYLKNTANQKDNTVTAGSTLPCSPLLGGGIKGGTTQRLTKEQP
jgi:hypothetical protein